MTESSETSNPIKSLLLECYEFIDDGYPPWVRARFVDANGENREFAFKTPMLPEQDEPRESTPLPTTVRVKCEVLRSEVDGYGGETLIIRTTHVETFEDDIREFRVRPDQLVDWPAAW